jgi:hypothetical protein
MPNVIALKVSAGILRQLDAADVIIIDRIEPRSGGDFTLAGSLGVGDALILGTAGEGFQLPGILETNLQVGAGLVSVGSSITDYLSGLWLTGINGEGPNLAGYNLSEIGTNAGAYAIGVDATLLANVPPAATDVMSALIGLDAALTASGFDTLQTAYAAGNTITVTAVNGVVDISNATDATDLLHLTQTFAGAGKALLITMGASATGAGLCVVNSGSGNAVEVKDGANNIFVVDGTGAVSLTALTASTFSTAAGDLSLSSIAAELSFGDVGGTITLSQSSDRSLIQTGVGEVFDGVTSIIAALNALAAAADLTGQAGIKEYVIENGVTITAGDTVAQGTVSGRVTQANANANANTKFVGISLETGTGDVGGTIKVRVALPGNFIADGGLTATAGDALFLPDGTGRVTTTAPVSTGDVVMRIGWAHETGAPSSSYLIDPAQAVIL